MKHTPGSLYEYSYNISFLLFRDTTQLSEVWNVLIFGIGTIDNRFFKAVITPVGISTP